MDIGLKQIIDRFKFRKSPVPEDAVILHDKTFKKAASLAKRMERMDDEKFTNEEFLLYIRLKIKIAKGVEEYQSFYQSIKYIEVGVAAQSSFIKLEQTELRYRSRKQQALYQFVADNITDNDNVDKDAFRDRVKRKLSEILPLVNSEQGRNALKSYVREVEKISQHDLGLKLLSLFKEYELDDFTILRTISNLVEQVKAQDILTDQNLMILVLENYEMLEKIAPVLGIAPENIKPAFFTKILQYMGLGRRHENAVLHFQDLVKTIRQWQKPFNSLKIIRQQYYNGEYHLPKVFYQEIPGLNIYHKYKEYLSINK